MSFFTATGEQPLFPAFFRSFSSPIPIYPATALLIFHPIVSSPPVRKRIPRRGGTARGCDFSAESRARTKGENNAKRFITGLGFELSRRLAEIIGEERVELDARRLPSSLPLLVEEWSMVQLRATDFIYRVIVESISLSNLEVRSFLVKNLILVYV